MNTWTQNSTRFANRVIAIVSPIALSLASAAMPRSPLASLNDNPCKVSAAAAKEACKRSALSDFWNRRAMCVNLPTHAERVQCTDDAFDELEDALHDCADQYAARLDLCSRLGGASYHPTIDPANFVAVIDNPYLPLLPGTTLVYSEVTNHGTERDDFIITHATRQILGVTCTVVHDIASIAGVTTEDTFDFFAQDAAGNVWYFGEQTLEYENGVPVSTEGSWEAGVDGASPGIVMKAAPQPGNTYRQEFLIGVAEDAAIVMSLDESVTVPYGSFDHCLQTQDFTPLEPDQLEHKFYAPGIGQVLTIDVDTGRRAELIDINTN